jgi:superfamily I DNA/RNA helicase
MKKGYTEEQLNFIEFSGPESIILSATAGSGKTHSTVGRLNHLLANGVDPNRIIFFSFTNDAVNELRNRIDNEVKITTIHSFTSSILGKLGKFKPIVTFYDFINWYRDKKKPSFKDPRKVREEYYKTIEKFYEEGASISSSFSAYKLQFYDGVRSPKPNYYDHYVAFLKDTNSRDFSDMLIDTEKLSKDPKHRDFFNGMYDYVFIDEYQDTSTLQMKILSSINAKQYYLIGDKNQSIYGFSGANCLKIEALLKQKKTVVELTLTKNFRSHKKIVENANKFSSLRAIPESQHDGYVDEKFINKKRMFEMMQDGKPLTVLVRTNNVIKEIEKQALKKKIPMRYFNYITKTDLENIKKSNITDALKKKLNEVLPYFMSNIDFIEFIESNLDSDVFVTSIHKSKGREFPRCIVINSADPEMIINYGSMTHDLSEYSFLTEDGDIDEESRNIHYVAVTRPKEELYFMIFDEI